MVIPRISLIIKGSSTNNENGTLKSVLFVNNSWLGETQRHNQENSFYFYLSTNSYSSDFSKQRKNKNVIFDGVKVVFARSVNIKMFFLRGFQVMAWFSSKTWGFERFQWFISRCLLATTTHHHHQTCCCLLTPTTTTPPGVCGKDLVN